MTTPFIELQLLGGFSLWVEGQRNRTVNAPRLQALLAFLALHQGVPQNRNYVAAQLWPDVEDSTARANLRKFLYKLKQAFPESEHFLETDASSIHWRIDPAFSLDVVRLQAVLKRQGTSDQATPLLHLYRGQLLPGCYDEWLDAHRTWLQQEVTTALLAHLSRLERLGDASGALPVCQFLAELDPLNEDIHRRLMHLHVQTGDRNAALKVYRTYSGRLRAEGEQPELSFQTEFQRLKTPSETESSRPAPPLLIGRALEFQRLEQLWKEAQTSPPKLVILSGESGVGKTHLMLAFEAHASLEPVRILQTRGFELDARLSYTPLVELLRPLIHDTLPSATRTELARLLPELLEQSPGLPTPEPMTEPWQQLRFHRAIASVLLTRTPLLLLLDDLHFFDSLTLQILHRLLRASQQSPLLILSTLRSDLLYENTFLKDTLLPLLTRDGLLLEMPLAPLSPDATRELAATLVRAPLDPLVAAQLYKRTNGLPLFVVELARAGLLDAGSDGHKALPPTLRALVDARLSGLGDVPVSLLALCAVAGESFEVEPILRCAGEPTDELVNALDLLERRLILIEKDHTYRFAHAILHQVAYERLSRARRHLLHHRLAQALLAPPGKPDARRLTRAAQHLELAGDFPNAIQRYLDAAHTAAASFAHEEARSLFERTLFLLQAHPNPEQHWIALSGLSEQLLLNASKKEFTVRLEQLETLYTQSPHPERLLRLQEFRASEALLRGNYLRAQEFADEGLVLARTLQAHPVEIRLLILQGRIQFQKSHFAASAEACAQAVHLAEIQKDFLLAANARVELAVANAWRGALDEAETQLAVSIATLERLENRRDLANALGFRALIYGLRARYEESERCLMETIEVTRELQDSGRLFRHLLNLGVTRLAQQRYRSGIEAFQECIELANSLSYLKPVANTYLSLTQAYAAIGLLDDAERSARRGIELLQQMDPCWEYAVLQAELASLHNAFGEGQAALDAVATGYQYIERHSDAFGENAATGRRHLELEAVFACVALGQQDEASRWLTPPLHGS